jgi:hypothetical protein
LLQNKAERDMTAAAKAPTGCIDAFKFVFRFAVSAIRRDGVSAAARRVGIDHVEIWSGLSLKSSSGLVGGLFSAGSSGRSTVCVGHSSSMLPAA